MISRILKRMGYEKRADSSYTDALVTAITANASGQTTAFPTATAALESCSGLVGRAFAAAEVSGPDYVLEALTPDCLSLIGRTLIRKGEILFGIEVMDGRLMLWPVSSHGVDGEHDPRSWVYRLNFAGPSHQTTWEKTDALRVVHVQYARDPETPWRGYGPLQVAQLAGRLSAETAAALADESSGPRGSFLPFPSKDGEDETLDLLKGDIKSAKGTMLLAESMTSGVHNGLPPPKGDWEQRRFGAQPPDSMVKLLGAASMEVMGACGLSPSLFLDGDGTGKREAWRQALFAVIAPLGKLVETELRAKLDAPELRIDWSELRASDLQARARSFKNMIEGGMDIKEAATLSGLLLPEMD